MPSHALMLGASSCVISLRSLMLQEYQIHLDDVEEDVVEEYTPPNTRVGKRVQ
jgi:hypothetical protein